MIGSKNVTQLLIDWNGGDKSALEKLLPMIYQELHLLASRYLRRERPNHTIQATALVNEAYLRLIDQKQVQWQNRAHFFAIAAQMMRRILINYARDQHAAKRGGYTIKVSLNEAIGLANTKDLDLIALDEALDKLALTDSRKSRLIELWFFAGLTLEETAEVLGISLATAKRDWTLARAWLYRAIKKGEDNGKMAKN
ncbi:MAG: sigma-70 family RNA polymerase sigma factor [Blastocatellia bacterium]|nr:sigma-70 family RNA polymerase sigma factor [Blastocatellia bacterium]MBL8192454.1 sigma-70 family RNA polymerase sigma factor [Blastocatellia bacterium]